MAKGQQAVASVAMVAGGLIASITSVAAWSGPAMRLAKSSIRRQDADSPPRTFAVRS